MPELHTDEAIRELLARGLVAALPAPRVLAGGNADRKDRAARASWCVTLPSGGRAKLTLGADLGALADRHAAFAAACPDIATAQLFYQRLSTGDALAEAYFEGSSLEMCRLERSIPPADLARTVARVCRCLTATEQPSSETARREEWQAWTRRLLALPVWRPEEKIALGEKLLPALYAQLASEPPVTRWTNGDFLPANLLLDASGGCRLVDTEFAARTHFFAEDAVRFRVLSAAALEQPELEAVLPPPPGLAWHLYFWLRQFQLENEHNTPEYLTRYQTARRALIRCLAEQGLGLTLGDWPTPPTVIHSHLEEARWLQEHGLTVRISGWCHVPSASILRGVIALRNGHPIAQSSPTLRADVQQHFASSPQAALSGFAFSADIGRLDASLTLCAIIDQGTVLPFASLATQDLARGAPLLADYTEWAARYDPDPPAREDTPAGPHFSVLLPVYNPPVHFLQACIQSVRTQHYPDWELHIVNDGSTAPEVATCLDEFARRDPRIRVRHLRNNRGISRATNAALAPAKGGFVVLLDHDDLLRPHALAEFAKELSARPELDAIYSDEDKITPEGRRIAPIFKPGFSPEFLLGVMYIGHALCVRTSVARAIGGFDPVYDGIQDYEFFLRLTERTRRIGHIPRILYHWRQSPGSSSLHGNVKGDMDQKQAMAVQAHLQRRHDRRKALILQGHRLRLSAGVANSTSRIGVILAWNREVSPAPRFWDCLGTLPIHLFALADVSVPAAVRATRLPEQSPQRALSLAAAADGIDTVVLLGAPFLSASADWLPELAACAALADSGCVAPLLMTQDRRVLESGWTAGPTGVAPIMRGYDAEGDGCHGSLRCTREVAAVSPLCVALNRKNLPQIPDRPEATWWEFCLRFSQAGLFNRVCPVARLTFAAPPPESSTVTIANVSSDAFFNPHFAPHRADYSLAAPPYHYVPAASHFSWFFDVLPLGVSLDGCLRLQGWLFHHNRLPAAVRVSVGRVHWTVNASEPRPDVALAYPAMTDGACGFRLSLRVPSGQHQLILEALAANGDHERLWVQPLAIPASSEFRRMLSADPTRLVSYQLMAVPTHAPHPIHPEKLPLLTARKTKPRISIVTPSYDQKSFLPETMRSVLEQNAAVDYVVQDGGSTDGSKAIIERFAEKGVWRTENGNLKSEPGGSSLPPPSLLLSPSAPRLVSWASERDNGQADAIVKGFAKTSGGPDDLMAWINSDDFYLPGALGFVAAYFAKHPDVDVIYGHRIVVDEQSREIGRWFLPKHDPAVLRLNDFVPQETLFWRRRLWDRVGGLDASFKFAMDWDLLLRFQTAGAKIVRVPYFLACFRVHAAQKTSARMHDVGQREIDLLRTRTHGREISATELESDPRLLRYLRRSAFIEFLWKLGLRAP